MVSLADLWADHSPLIECVAHARYIQKVARHGFGDPAGKIIMSKVRMWQSVLTTLSRSVEHIRLEDKLLVAEWLDELNDIIGGQ